MSSKVIAIDGSAYVGKSQIARALARMTGYEYINTGHMYRSVARLALERGIVWTAADQVVQLAGEMEIVFKAGRTWVNGADWTDSLEEAAIVLGASKIASIPALREILTDLQRRYAREKMIVMEGRDIGSVVFPDAAWKFFVTASLEIRAVRMKKTVTDRSQTLDFYKAKIMEIDEADRNRKIAPLVQAPDAILYDNSESPTAEQDAVVLHYYLTHREEIIQNTKILQLHRTEG